MGLTTGELRRTLSGVPDTTEVYCDGTAVQAAVNEDGDFNLSTAYPDPVNEDNSFEDAAEREADEVAHEAAHEAEEDEGEEETPASPNPFENQQI